MCHPSVAFGHLVIQLSFHLISGFVLSCCTYNLAIYKIEKPLPLFIQGSEVIRLRTESFPKVQNIFPADEEKFRFLSVYTNDSDQSLEVAIFYSFYISHKDTFAARSFAV